MSGIDEQPSEYPDCPRCLRGRFWQGRIGADSVVGFKYIYFNHDPYRGRDLKLKKVAIYDVPKGKYVESEYGRYATKEEIEASYEIICASCKTLAVKYIVSIIKKVAINHIRRIGH